MTSKLNFLGKSTSSPANCRTKSTTQGLIVWRLCKGGGGGARGGGGGEPRGGGGRARGGGEGVLEEEEGEEEEVKGKEEEEERSLSFSAGV